MVFTYSSCNHSLERFFLVCSTCSTPKTLKTRTKLSVFTGKFTNLKTALNIFKTWSSWQENHHRIPSNEVSGQSEVGKTHLKMKAHHASTFNGWPTSSFQTSSSIQSWQRPIPTALKEVMTVGLRGSMWISWSSLRFYQCQEMSWYSPKKSYTKKTGSRRLQHKELSVGWFKWRIASWGQRVVNSFRPG